MATYLVWLTLLYFQQDSIMFPVDAAGTAPSTPTNDRTVALFEDIEGEGKVHAWYDAAPGASSENPAPIVIFFHGNAELINHISDIVQNYHRLGVSVLRPEFRGYGQAAGEPSQDGIVEDGLRFHDTIVERSDVDRSRIVIHGRSIGGGVAAQVAAKANPKPAALILESTLLNTAKMAHQFGAPGFLANHPFRTDLAVESLDVPTLIFHGSNDRIIPPIHGRELRHLVPTARYKEYAAGHNDFPGQANHDDYWARIRSLLEEAGVLGEAK